VQSDELRILGIPRSRQTVANIDSNHGASWKGSHCLLTQATRHTRWTGQACRQHHCRARAAQNI